MSQPLVIGLDSSTQSTKAIAWNRTGECVAIGRADIPMDNPRLDCYEQNPLDWWTSAVSALKECTAQVNASDIQGLAISNQRETLAFMDDDGEAVHPAILWLDERSRHHVKSFPESFGYERIHQITGRIPDTTPCLYTFAWMREEAPEIWNSTRYFVDVQAYLVKRLCGGPFRTGWISADPMGLIDMVEKWWSADLLDALSLTANRLPQIHAPGTELGRIMASVAAETGLPLNLPVYAAGGDGQCAGLGVNCTSRGNAYINLGTAVVSGMWSDEYRYNQAWRTELAAQGEGYIYETCLRSGAFLVNWFVDQFVAHGKADASVFAQLEKAALQLPIGSEGLLVSPYFSGAMNPHWDVNARGVMIGLSASHKAPHIYRAIIEAITLDQAMSIADMERESDQTCKQIVAIGGGANSELWRQMLCDSLGKPVHVSTTFEASSLGAAMIAAYGAGWFDSIVEAANSMAGQTSIVHPDAERHASYQSLLSIYRKLYHCTASLNHELLAFANARQARP